MRFRKTVGPLTVTAVAGTRVVMLGMDMPEADTAGLLGFAIRRVDPAADEDYYLTGMRTFKASYPNPPAGSLVSTREHPVQDFMWSDFTAKPAHAYTYEVIPVRGKPKRLTYDPGVSIDVRTEREDVPATQRGHGVYFNSGVIGSQAYARKWTRAPNKLTGVDREKAYEWLSRGLAEALLAFIQEAKDGTYALRAAFYEFSWTPVAEALAAAQDRSADVRLVYDARVPVDRQGDPDAAAAKRVAAVKALIAAHGLHAVGRTKSPNAYAHNKFIVLLRDQKPIAVWTGSTNITESGIFGQANVGHLVRDPDVAAQYLAYWDRLSKDPESGPLCSDNEAATPTLAAPPEKGTTLLFSPRKGTKQLQWYADEIDRAAACSCFTGAFGVNARLLKKYGVDQDYLRYLFLEKWGTNAASSARTREALGIDRDVQVAVGATLKDDILHRWLLELTNTLSPMIKYVHTKFMLIDPFGADPVVIAGSANFSDDSTTANDENMLVIRGDRRVADIYAGEFMRLWRHHRYRFIVNDISESTGEVLGPNYLDPTAAWAALFYKAASVKLRRRGLLASGRGLIRTPGDELSRRATRLMASVPASASGGWPRRRRGRV